eukprot:IDg10513t1
MKLTRHINVMSRVLRTTPENDDLGLLYAISEGFNEVEKIKEDWRAAIEKETQDENEIAPTQASTIATLGTNTEIDTTNSQGNRFNAGHSIDNEIEGVVTQDGIQLHQIGSRHQATDETDENNINQGAFGTSKPAFLEFELVS